MKSSMPMAYSSVNAQKLQATNSLSGLDYTVYVSAGMVFQGSRQGATYTKHYYAGPLRVASHIGSGNPNQVTHPTSGGNKAQGGPAGSTGSSNGLAVLGDLNGLLANYGMSVPPTAPPTDTIAMQVLNDPAECDAYYGDDVIEKNRCLCDHFPDVALQQGIDCSPYTPIYWYHPDYIGNVEFVSDRTGQPYQHFYYAPFGDPMVSQHVGTGSFNSAFRFNAKEYDEETGNYYYGARYYEPKSSIWMGVDALATSYPGMNPYNFVMGNPIMAMDPDGDTTVYALAGTDEVVILNSPGEFSYETVSQEDWEELQGLVTEANLIQESESLSLVGGYFEGNFYSVWIGQDYGKMYVENIGWIDYRTEHKGLKTEAVSIGASAGVILYTGNSKDLERKDFFGRGSSAEFNGSTLFGDFGLNMTWSQIRKGDKTELLIFAGPQASIGAGTPFISGGRTNTTTVPIK
jgi:RHS repeat-associated protein